MAVVVVFGTQLAAAQTAGAGIDAATSEEKVSASDAFNRGMQAYQEARFADALESFDASYGIVASPNSLLMRAKTLVALKRKPEAHDLLLRVVSEAEDAAAKDQKYAQTRTAAEEELATLRAELAFVKLTGIRKIAKPGAELRVGGRPIPEESWDGPIAAKAGVVRIELSGVQTRDVEIAAGKEAAVDLAKSVAEAKAEEEARLAAEQEEHAGADLFAGGIISLGIGVAGMAVFGTFGGLALTKKSELDDSCVEMRCPSDLSSAAEEGKAFQLTADIALGIGIAGLLTGGGLLIAHFSSEDGGGEAEAALVVTPGSIGVSGRFQ
jgi:hypothetical protein